jgi:hypothetical protein
VNEFRKYVCWQAEAMADGHGWRGARPANSVFRMEALEIEDLDDFRVDLVRFTELLI